MNAVIKEFMGANSIKRRTLVRCGFELETQCTESEGDETDYEAADQAIADEASNIYSDNVGHDLRDLLSNSLLESIQDEIREGVTDNFDYSDYQTSSTGTIKRAINNSNVEVVDDSSVSGVEMRTRGGLKYKEFTTALSDCFGLVHEIDTKCSFHIHLSLPHVRHSYGERFQLALVEYLIEAMPRLPETVRERFQGAPENKYIQGLTSSRHKYSFVNAHSLNTWEFRCFGNVKNTGDGITCLNIAIEALAYAYDLTKNGKALMTDSYDGDIEQLLKRCLTRLQPVSIALRNDRKISNKRA